MYATLMGEKDLWHVFSVPFDIQNQCDISLCLAALISGKFGRGDDNEISVSPCAGMPLG